MLLHVGQPWLDGDAELADALGGGWHELYVYCSVLGPFAYLECEKADFCRILGVQDSYLGQLADPLSLNRYLYCLSDPLNWIDSDG